MRVLLSVMIGVTVAACAVAQGADEFKAVAGLDGIQFAYPPAVIFRAKAPWTQAREPVLRRMGDGTLMCLHYSGGPREPHDDNVVLITRSTDDGATWSEPELLFSHQTRGVWATEVFTEGPKPIIFLHTFDAASHYVDLRTYWSFSGDQGKTWSGPVSVPGGLNCSVVRQGIVLQDGTWLFPVYWQEVYGGWDWAKKGKDYGGGSGAWRFCSGVWRSEDQGKSFTLHGRIHHSKYNMWEPNIVEVAPNRLVMLLRADGAGVCYRADSEDGGRTWSEPRPTDIPDPGAKITLLTIGSAVILLHDASAKGGWGTRTPLELWVSRDGCNTWPVKRRLAHAPDPGTAICYPHAFADADQEILYVACDSKFAHYLLKVPFADFLK